MARREMICKSCSHPKRQHANQGCTHYNKNYIQCSCTVTSVMSGSDLGNFEEGIPLDD